MYVELSKVGFIRFFTKYLVIALLLTGASSHGQSPVASFSVNMSSGCTPMQVQFTNTSQNAVSYQWDFGNGNFSTAVNPVNVYLSPGTFTVKLVAVNASGQADSIIRSGLIQTVAPPVANFTSSSTSACLENNAISFTNLSAGFDSCLWDFGDGNTSGQFNPVHSYLAPGTYTITLIVYNTTMGCSSSLSKTSHIQILSNPAATFTANITATCDASEPIIFTPQASSAISWLWQFGDGTTSTSPNPTHTYGQPGTYNVTLITGNQLGCTDTVTMAGYILIRNNPVPVILSSNGFNGCMPFLTNFSSTTTGISSRIWDFGDTTSSLLNAPNHQYLNAGTYQVRLTATYSNSCVNSSQATVQVSARPVVTYTITNHQGCAPLTPVFTNTTTGPGYTYLWDFGDGTTSTQQNPVHAYTNTGTFSPTLTVTDSVGCSKTQNTFTIITVTSASALFTADDVTGCNPHTVNFTHPGGSLYTYNWNFGDGTTSTLQSPSHTYTANGNFTVTLTVSNTTGCTNTYTYPQQVQISNGSNNFIPSPPVTACAPFTINLYDNSPSTSSWLWDFGDGTTSALQNPVHTYTTPGTYVVSLQTQSSGSACSQYISPYGTYIINAGEADFQVSQTLCPPYVATFTDNSQNAVAWFWDFGDGTTSTQQNPVHIYSQPGSYNVSLTITTAQGCTFTMYHNYAVTFIPLYAHATATTNDSIPPLTVDFQAGSSGATSWFWDFGDGGTSTDMNPTYVFNGPGPYNISLTISNQQCTITYDYPAVEFGVGAILPGGTGDSTHVPDPVYSCTPYEMSFSSPVQDAVSWLWDFGDGVTSTLENPAHIYVDPGVYTVTLFTWDSLGVADTIIQPSAFYLTGATADFTYGYANGCSGSTITINNNSQNGMAFHWDFGDGTTSTDPNPVHTYTTTGVNYIIALTVTDTLGCTDFMARSYYAATTMPMNASSRRGCAGDTIYFNSSNISFTTYLWDFGDGATSTAAAPYHIYADSGNYQVTLTVMDAAGCTNSWNLPYLIRIRKPVANFTAQMANSGCLAVRYQFTNLSTGADSYLWDFSHGTYSTLVNPLQIFQIPGYYDVTLTASAEGCSSTFTMNQLVYVPTFRAGFSYSQSSDCFPVTVAYTDSSTDAVSWLWEFGDGTSSTLRNPVHVFNSKPTGDVKLTVTSYTGCILQATKPNITAMDIRYTLSDTAGCMPFTLSVIDSSTHIASWAWDFGDGTTSTLSAPAHTYTAAGSYPVSLTATSPSGCVQTLNPLTTITTYGPHAMFTMDAIVSCAPTIVNFYDSSTGATSWNWNFGNQNHSTLSDPVHVYNQPGTYDVTLVVSDSIGCTDTLLIPELVHITGSLANFTVGSTSGCSPWSVQFNDSSISAFSWLWNFGDGNTSSQPNPVHIYDTPGNYMVTLVTSDTTGCESVFTSPAPLVVQEPPTAAFTLPASTGCVPFLVLVNNTSTGATAWQWDFGDGVVSQLENPLHTYTTPGIYTITLVASNTAGCSDTLVYTVPIVVQQPPVPSFTITNASGCAPVTAQFLNTSQDTNPGSVYFWNFGDGSTSNIPNPSHTYQQQGIYSVSLTVINSGTCSAIDIQANVIVVSGNTPLPPVLLKSVSVVDSTAIDITWANLPSTGLQAYNLYRYNPSAGQYNLIYTDPNPGNTSLNLISTYTDHNVLTANQTYTYLVQATNLCGIGTPLNQLIPHTSINLDVAVVNSLPELRWNFYSGCSTGGYKIYRQDDLNGPFNLVGATGSAVSQFTDSTVYCGSRVAYRVCAISLCGENYTAWSDIEMADVPGMLENQKVDMVRSTVVDDSYVFTEWTPPALYPQLVTAFELYRSTDNVNFTLLATLPPTETNYSDFDTRVKEQNYFYRVQLKSTCETISQDGLESSSILLKGGVDDRNDTWLRWTPYVNWDTGVDYYIIEKLDEFGIWQTLKIVGGSVLEYHER